MLDSKFYNEAYCNADPILNFEGSVIIPHKYR